MKFEEALRKWVKVKRVDWVNDQHYTLEGNYLNQFCDGEKIQVDLTILELEANDWVPFEEQSLSPEAKLDKIKEILGVE